MRRLVDKTLEVLRQRNPETAEEGILLALSFYEKSRGRLDGLVCRDVLEEEATEKDLINLRNELVKLVTLFPSESFATSAVFVLGKWEDPTLKSLFVEFVRVNYESNNSKAMYQAMIALEDLGEDVFPRRNGRMSASLSEFERNREVAQRYLNKENKCQ